MSARQVLFHLNGFQQESNYCMQSLGFNYRPTPFICSNIREFNRANQRLPSLQELVEFLYVPCNENCDYYVPIDFGIPILEYVMVHFGMFPRCRDIYFCHTYQMIEHRYPTLDEFIQSIEEEPNEEFAQQMNRWMSQDVDEYWNHLSPHSVHLPIRAITTEELTSSLACCICQEDILAGQEVMTLPCDHTFHATSEACEGIQPWISKVGSCPLCKKELPEELRSSIPQIRPPLPERPPREPQRVLTPSPFGSLFIPPLGLPLPAVPFAPPGAPFVPPIGLPPLPVPVPVPPPIQPVQPFYSNLVNSYVFRNQENVSVEQNEREPYIEFDFTELLDRETSEEDINQIVRDVFSRLFNIPEDDNESVHEPSEDDDEKYDVDDAEEAEDLDDEKYDVDDEKYDDRSSGHRSLDDSEQSIEGTPRSDSETSSSRDSEF